MYLFGCSDVHPYRNLATASHLRSIQATTLRPRHIRVRKVLALEEKLGAVRFGAGVGQTIAEIQAGEAFAVLP